MYKLIAKVIEKNQLDVSAILDTCLAICFADKFNGSNRLELSVDRFVSGADNDWNNVLSLLGVQSKQNKPLPEVQRYRVICDALVILCDKHESDIYLTSEASAKVATLQGKVWRCTDYSDINEVEKVLTALCKGCFDFSAIYDLEAKLWGYAEDLKQYGYDMHDGIRRAWRNFTLPGKFKYISKGEMKYENEDIALQVLQDLVMCQLEYDAIEYISESVSKNSVGINVNISRAMLDLGIVGFGMCSYNNYAPSIKISEAGIPSVIVTKLNRLFSRNMTYDIQDLENVCIFLKYLYDSKAAKRKRKER